MSRHVVVFDMDDTLFFERDFVRSGYRAVCRHLAREGRLDDPDRAFRWLWERFEGGKASGAYDALGRRFSLGLSPADVQSLVAVYRTHEPRISPIAGVRDILEDLRRAGVHTALITDGPAVMQRGKFDALGLAAWMDHAVFTAELPAGGAKPSAAAYHVVQDRFQAKPDRCVYVADNPAKDFVAPNALGWHGVLVRYGRQVHAHKAAAPNGAPKCTVRSLDQLKEELRRWLGFARPAGS